MSEDNKLRVNDRGSAWVKDGIEVLTMPQYGNLVDSLTLLLHSRIVEEKTTDLSKRYNLTQQEWHDMRSEIFSRIEKLYE